jgi:hypothetical protein
VSHAERSADALARAVLLAIEQRDIDRLRQLALNEQEFREIVWPELPAARPERNVPFGYAWSDLRTKSETSLKNTLSTHGGRHLELVRVRFPGGTTQYDSYLVHRDTVVVARGTDGIEEDVRLFGSVLEQDGRFKVFSYVVD